MKIKNKRSETKLNENEIIKVTSGDRKVMMEAMLETRPKSPRLKIISISGGSGTKTDEFSENFMSQILEL